MFDKIVYHGFRWLIGWVGKLDFEGLYRLSDKVSFLLRVVIRYRLKVARTNLSNAFPDKSSTEIEAILKQFYTHLSDVFLEALKAFTLNPEELVERYRVSIPEEIDDHLRQGRSGIGLVGHYANWEWGILCGGLQFPVRLIGYYRPIKNKYINHFVREKFNGINNAETVPVREAYKAFLKYRHDSVAHLLVADQSPTTTTNVVWLEFLNQETACLIGAERYAKRLDLLVYYLHIERQARGRYAVELKPLSLQPKETADEEITRKFMGALEAQILEKPANWLWTHKRWKHRRMVD